MIQMREKLHFQKRGTTTSPWTGEEIESGEYETVFTEPARLKPGLGSETIIANRIQGIQPYTATVRSSTRTRGVGTDWRVVDARDGREFAIKSIVNPDERDRYLDMIVIEGALE